MLPQAPLTAGLLASAGVRSPDLASTLGLSMVSSKSLESLIKKEDLLDCSRTLQKIAYDTPGRNRVMGSLGHNSTVDYLQFELEQTGYYRVRRQPFTSLVQDEADAFMTVDGVDQHAGILRYSPAGHAKRPLVLVANLGCDRADYPDDVRGNIALVERGDCPFGTKAALAHAAGAVAAVVYNNAPGELNGTLGVPEEDRPFAPSVGLSDTQGKALRERIEAGESVSAHIAIHSVITSTTTENVIAESIPGNPESVLAIGAHTDSVDAGPGINDNGSGTCGTLQVAKALAKFDLKNQVNFYFFSGEESGLLGSTHFVKSASEKELAPLRLYLNFDMIASPNYVYGVYDGDGSTFGETGPAGSAEAEHFFEHWFENKKIPTVPSRFDGRSDYGPFLSANIAAGGLFTGAEQVKTEEEQRLFGGTAGVAYDENYHQVGDTFDNLNPEAYLVNSKAIAAAVATFGKSFDLLGPGKGPSGYGPDKGPSGYGPARRSTGLSARASVAAREQAWIAEKQHLDLE